ncbi:IMS domain-containing protein [Prochlorococcus sp. MIT 1223]|uniref:IMS domain-containing protein n=1 Tax=Prochlorococcus sp. MIT 1223 TaxID=3096217 RepID=UPI002A75EE3F|nr:IMS domain-containing protein [Prochlorococcus sp. MIT 1223]
MELPIDHFRLLGVSPSAEAEEILRVFQLRLDRIPDQDFTNEVLSQRSELLRLSADLLSDGSQRKEYENAISLGASGLDLSSNREVAGLILLWEADFPQEAFNLARKSLQPPQTPALGSGREADLALLAALSCRDASMHQQEQRHYEFAAEILQEGIQLLQRMGKLPEQQQLLEEDLELLLPFRILDLLSRELDDTHSHQVGLNLLESFIAKRGGLEGRGKIRNFGGLKQGDFELFFQQIRSFLTVQEQIDLFINLYRQGSVDAGFLSSISLVASGFTFKRPDHLQEARKYLKALNYEGLDPMPLIGCIDLLLGDIKQAQARFRSSNDPELKEWLDNYPGEELAAFCHYCRNWLQNDVLRSFRDIQNIYPDLDAWFSDQNVQEYLEQLDSKGARGLARAGRTFISSLTPEKSGSISLQETSESEGSLPMPGGLTDTVEELNSSLDETSENGLLEKVFDLTDLVDSIRINISNLSVAEIRSRLIRNPRSTSVIVFFALFFAGTLIGLVNLNLKSNNGSNIKEFSKTKVMKSLDKEINNKITLKEDLIINKSKIKNKGETLNPSQVKIKTNDQKFKPLISETPSVEQVKKLIEEWLYAKSTILSGGKDVDFSKFARENLAKRVDMERSKDISLGQKQIINASVKSIKIVSRSNKRIAVQVDLNYEDKRINRSGESISETVIPSLKVQYILGREKDLWQLVDYVSGL